MLNKIHDTAFKLIKINFSSPIRTPLIDNEIVLMNPLYKERFPEATQQMEELRTGMEVLSKPDLTFCYLDISTRCLKTWKSCWSRPGTSLLKLRLI